MPLMRAAKSSGWQPVEIFSRVADGFVGGWAKEERRKVLEVRGTATRCDGGDIPKKVES